MRPHHILVLTLWLIASNHLHAESSDWLRHRGPNGSGRSDDGIRLPIHWDTDQNLKWLVPLPGPGQSSPIVIGNRIILTCWTGYGLDKEAPGDQHNLKYHLLCLDRRDGRQIWSRTIQPKLPEHAYGGMLALHGYATHTPVSDGQTIFAFFGKTGVFAFDLEGKQRWQTSVGSTLDSRRWGSSASPILHGDLLIVTASVEDQALVAIHKGTGGVIWKQRGKDLANIWGTPALAKLKNRTELIVAAPFRLRAFDADTGEPLWYGESARDNTAGSGVMVHEGVAFVVGARFGGTTAIRAGGRGDVTDTWKLWGSRYRGRTATPILHKQHLYWIFSRVAYCLQADTGESLYRARLKKTAATGGGPSRDDYASPVASDELLYQLTQDGEMLVIEMGREFREITRNRFEGGGIFCATPAISRGELFVRSSKHLYCVSNTGNYIVNSPRGRRSSRE